MSIFMNFIAGMIFGVGLVISGMINPARVTNFLDIAGQWDPTLAVVMAAALTVTALGYRLVFSMQKPKCAEKFDLPKATEIDQRLIVGSTLFGIGWGLFGFCPGPAIASLWTGRLNTLVFAAAMFAGAAAAGSLWSARRPS
jgi:hypothetical protein